MGKELPLARPEEEGQSVLLASSGSGEPVTTSSIRNKRTQGHKHPRGDERGETKSFKAESKGSRKAERTNASASTKAGRRRDNKDRKSDRGDEGKDKSSRRSAQKLGIVHPGSYCDKSEIVPHHWIEVENILDGSLFRCRLCLRHLWLPRIESDAKQLSALVEQHGRNEGYCQFLNQHRPAKMLMAKLQDLRRLEAETADKREFARMADKILSDREYDRK